MKFYTKKYLIVWFLLLLISCFFLADCSSKTDNASLSNQKSETNNQTVIRVSETENNSAEPSITADSQGNIYVVFVEHTDKNSADIYLQKFDKDAKPNGEKTRINPEQGQAKAWFGDAPTIKIGSDSTIYIGWTAKVESKEKPNATTLFLSVSRDGGKTFDTPVKVNDDSAPTSHGMHSLAVGENGKVFMAWLDERNIKFEKAENFSGDQVTEPRKNNLSSDFQFVKAHHNSNQNSQANTKESKLEKKEMSDENAEPNSEVFFAASNDGGKTFSKNIKISSEVCPCCKTNLAIGGNGKIYASWRQVVGDNFRHIAVASSENSGRSFSNYMIVSNDQWQINACPVSGAPLQIDKENNLKTIWFTSGKAGNPGLYFSESKDGGKTFAPRKIISENIVSGTSAFIMNENGEFRAVFEAEGKIFLSDLQTESKQIGEGKNPSAVFSNGKLWTAFVKKEGEKSGVWLSSFN